MEKYYPVSGGLFNRSTSHVKTASDVSFGVYPGETFAIVGESGCRKTALGKTVARLYESIDGSISFGNREIINPDGRALHTLRHDVQVVYQDPLPSLNPWRHIGDIVKEPLVVHDIGTSTGRGERVANLLERVDFPVDFRHRHPNTPSGGQQRHVTIARAPAVEPKFVMLDGPTSAPGVGVQARVIPLLDELQEEPGLTYLTINHGLSPVKNVADRIGVMCLGNFMEVVDSHRLFESPRNPYIEQLLSAIPVVEFRGQDLKPDVVEMSGGMPGPANPPSDCPFDPRCHHAFDACNAMNPELVEVEPSHLTHCLHDSGPEQDDVDAYLVRDQADRERADGDHDRLAPLGGCDGCRAGHQERNDCDRTGAHSSD